MDLNSANGVLQNIEISEVPIAENQIKNNVEISTQNTESKLPASPKGEAVIFLLEKFSQVISQIYEEMGIGKYIDFNA